MSIILQTGETKMQTAFRETFCDIFEHNAIDNYHDAMLGCYNQLEYFMKSSNFGNILIDGVTVDKDLLNFEFRITEINNREIYPWLILTVRFSSAEYKTPMLFKEI